MTQQILVITDDLVWQQSIRTILAPLRFELTIVDDPVKGLKKAVAANPNLIILDAQLPLLDHSETCQLFRQISKAPIIKLMVEGSHKGLSIKALKMGADVCLVKPVSDCEFQAWVNALLRRKPNPGEADQTKVYWNRDLMIDFHKRIVKVRGKPVHFSPTEYKLLTCLVQHRDRVLPHLFFLSQVWGSEATDQTKYLGPYINSLRKKIERNPSQPTFIKNRRGIGYRFACSTPSYPPT